MKFLIFSFLNIQKLGMNAQTMIDANGRNFDADCSSMCLFIIMAKITITIMIMFAWPPVETVM